MTKPKNGLDKNGMVNFSCPAFLLTPLIGFGHFKGVPFLIRKSGQKSTQNHRKEELTTPIGYRKAGT